VFGRLFALATLALLVAVPAHGAAKPTLPAPSGLKAFLLRADELTTDTFARTPSFAWAPYSGELRYDFELATSRSFDDSSIIWSTAGRNPQLRSPVVSIPLSLPWMTGKPYALYAHVRAVTRYGTTPWSTPLGFNMRWKNLPEQIVPDVSGLVRWNPVEGATSYDVWFLDAGKVISTVTNVADEREYYTFHQDPSWSGVVHWRVRAVRKIYGAVPNGLPVVAYGPWSSTFTSTNEPITDGLLTLDSSVSDVVGTADAPKLHSLTPGFAWSGDQTFDGTSSDLYRVYIATDPQCVNIVYRGPVVGSPAYAPRISGALQLPTTQKDETAAEDAYLPDGSQTGTFTADYLPITSSEETGATKTSSSASSSSSSASPSSATDTGSTGGAPVDLWDSGWPSGRYYWTVVPVEDVLGVGDSVQYYDLEVPQDACVEGRVASFGKGGEPATGLSGKPYATGLTPGGQLVSAKTAKPLFYGAPLVSWQPALGATSYEVEWSKQLYPWKPISKPLETEADSAMLEGLTPGTWYYRVRGLDPYLPGSAKQMAWSDPVAIQIAQPVFKVDVVDITGSSAPASTAAPASTKKVATSSSWNRDFTLVLPTGWHAVRKDDLLVTKAMRDLGSTGLKFEFLGVNSALSANVSVLKGGSEGGMTFAQWQAAVVAEVKRDGASEPILAKKVTFAGNPGLVVSYGAKKDGRALWYTQYAARVGSAEYVMTFTTGASLQAKFAPAFARIASSFRLS
jgi:hypothetical protein